VRFSRSNPTAAVTIAYLSSARLHEVCFADDVDVDEAQLQTCFGSSQDIFGATETGYLLFYEAVDRGSSGDPPTSG
jgi:hypothetical protein